MTLFHRLPFWLRFGLFLAISIGLWSLVFPYLEMSFKEGMAYMGAFVGINFIFVLAWHMIYSFRAYRARKRLGYS